MVSSALARAIPDLQGPEQCESFGNRTFPRPSVASGTVGIKQHPPAPNLGLTVWKRVMGIGVRSRQSMHDHLLLSGNVRRPARWALIRLSGSNGKGQTENDGEGQISEHVQPLPN